jgi:hypothetical protein
MSDDGTRGSGGTRSMSRKMEGHKRDGGERAREGARGKRREREAQRGIPGYRCRHTGARGCNALLMNTKNFIKDCLYIKLSTKLCSITPVAPSHAWKLLAAAMALPCDPHVPLMILRTDRSRDRRYEIRIRCMSKISSIVIFS